MSTEQGPRWGVWSGGHTDSAHTECTGLGLYEERGGIGDVLKGEYTGLGKISVCNTGASVLRQEGKSAMSSGISPCLQDRLVPVIPKKRASGGSQPSAVIAGGIS